MRETGKEWMLLEKKAELINFFDAGLSQTSIGKNSKIK